MSGKNYYQHYPNISGDILLENDKVVVQKFTIEPGQWEGVHSHPGNQLAVHIKGGEWTVFYGSNSEKSVREDGSIEWFDAICVDEKHESGNTGETPIELLWITLKDQK